MKRIACLRTDRIGDMLLTLPAIAGIKLAHPGCHLAIVCSPGTVELVRGESWVDETFVWSAKDGIFPLVRFLRNGGFDAAVFFYPRPLTALAAFLAGVGVRIGTLYRWYSPLFNRRVRQRRSFNERHETEYGFELARELGVPVPSSAEPLCPTMTGGMSHIAECALPDPYGVVHPGCGGSALNAGPGYYARVVRAMEASGMSVVLTGTEGERELMLETAVAAGIPAGRCLFPRNLKTLADILRGAVGVVGPATGPIHLASVLGAPVVALYAPLHSQHPRRWGPLGRRVKVLTPHEPTCPRCERESCPLYNCVERIHPDAIVTALRELAAQ